MITEVTRPHNSNGYKIHCETCKKVIDVHDGEMGAMDMVRIAMVRGIADGHERLHPEHVINLIFFEYELPIVGEMRDRLNSLRD